MVEHQQQDDHEADQSTSIIMANIKLLVSGCILYAHQPARLFLRLHRQNRLNLRIDFPREIWMKHSILIRNRISPSLVTLNVRSRIARNVEISPAG